MPGGLYTPIDGYQDQLRLNSDLQTNQIQNLLRSVQAQSALRDMQEENAWREDMKNAVNPDGSMNHQKMVASLYAHAKPETAINLQNALRNQQSFDMASKWLNSYGSQQPQPTQQPQQNQSGPTGAFDASQSSFMPMVQKLIAAEQSGKISDEGKQVLGSIRNQFGQQQQATQQESQPSNGPYGVPMQSLAFMLSGMPGLEKAGSAIAEAAKMQNVREGGSLWQLGPDGKPSLAAYSPKLEHGITLDKNGAANGVPNFLPELQKILQAKATVENRNTVSDKGQTPYGAPVMRTKQQDIDLANGNQGGMVPESKPPLVPGIQQIPGMQQPGGIGFANGPSMRDKASFEERGKQLADAEAKINESASMAQEKMARNNKMLELLPSIESGPLAKRITTFKTLMDELGIPLTGKDPSTTQEFEKYAYQNAISAGKQAFGARVTNLEVDTLIKSNPGASLTKIANLALLGLDNRINQRNLDKATQYYNYVDKGGDPARFELWFNQQYPIEGLRAPSSNQSASQSSPTYKGKQAPTPQQIVDELRRRGTELRRRGTVK